MDITDPIDVKQACKAFDGDENLYFQFQEEFVDTVLVDCMSLLVVSISDLNWLQMNEVTHLLMTQSRVIGASRVHYVCI